MRRAAGPRRCGRCSGTSSGWSLYPPDGRPPAALGRFASRPNELWPGDALHGPAIAGQAYLFAFLDDHSRAVMAARWGYFEDSVRLAAALRPALAARGVPAAIYVDNGSAFVDAALMRAAARLGIKITHSQPAGPGPGENRTLFRSGAAGVPRRDRRRLVHQGPGAAEQAVHRLVRDDLPHPAARGDRAAAGGAVACRALFATPSPEQLREAFLWSELRTVAKTATISCSAASTRPTRCWPPPRRVRLRPVRPSRGRGPLDGKPYGLRGRSTSAATPIPRPSRRPPPLRRHGHRDRLPGHHRRRARAGRPRRRIRYDALRGGEDDEQEDGQ